MYICIKVRYYNNIPIKDGSISESNWLKVQWLVNQRKSVEIVSHDILSDFLIYEYAGQAKRTYIYEAYHLLTILTYIRYVISEIGVPIQVYFPFHSSINLNDKFA